MNANTITLSNVDTVKAVNVEVTNLKPTVTNGTINVFNATLSNLAVVSTDMLMSDMGVIDINRTTLSNVNEIFTDKITTPVIESLNDQISMSWARVLDVDSLVVRSNITILLEGSNTVTNLPTDVVRVDHASGKILDALISSNIVRMMGDGTINPALIPGLYTSDRASFVKSMDKVGIGIRNPAQKLHVYGNQVITGGSLGVGVTTPLSALHVYNDNGSMLESFRVQTVGTTDIMGIYGSNDYPVLFANSLCNIGVRKSNPTYALDVNGTGAFDRVRTQTLDSSGGTIDCSCNILANVFQTDIQQATINELYVTNNLYVPQNVSTTNATILNALTQTLSTNTITSSHSSVTVNVGMNITGSDTTLASGLVTSGTKVGLNVSEYIVAKATLTTSDQRVKKDIQESNTADDLETVLTIPVRRFKFVDNKFEPSEVHGFIAQEVEKVVPYAVRSVASVIPDIMTSATWESDRTLSGMGSDILDSLKIGDVLKVIVDDTDHCLTVRGVDVRVDHLYFVEEVPKGTTVFVYGRVVSDFKMLDMSRLIPTVFGAVKELTTKITGQQKTLDALLERVAVLEEIFNHSY
jgi:hypothetical protein